MRFSNVQKKMHSVIYDRGFNSAIERKIIIETHSSWNLGLLVTKSKLSFLFLQNKFS